MTFEVNSALPQVYESYDLISPAHYTGKLKDKVILITGASSGIGKEAALAFAAAGASVACAARRKDRLDALVADIKARYDVPALAVAADVSDAETPKKLIAEVEHGLGPIDILVNNAGITRVGALATEDDFARYWRTMEVNVRAPIALTHAVLPSMIARKTGVIINVSSRAAVLDIPMMSAYATSKAALTKFTQNLALEVAEHGVLCYSIHPGTVMTEVFESDGAVSAAAAADPKFQALLAGFMSLKFQGPDIMANACVAMCADERWAVMSGRFVDMEQPLDEVLKEVEKPGMGRVGKEGLYRMKIDML